MSESRTTIVIASPLEADLVDRIRAAEPDRVTVHHDPALLSAPRYKNDHHGIPPTLTEDQHRRWRCLLHQADILFDFGWEDPRHLLRRAPNVRWIQATSAGIGDYVRKLEMPNGTVKITTAAGVHAQPLAEFVALAMLYFARDVPTLRTWQVAHHWERYCGQGLAGSTALIIGVGRVGQRVAEVVSSLGVGVLGQRRSSSGPPLRGISRFITADELDGVLPQMDYVIVAAPYTSETHRLLDARRLALLKTSAVLINIGRGKVVEEEALVTALQQERLRGAALDVFEQEPLPATSPLWDMPNVLVSPHSASTVMDENRRIVDLFIENLHCYLDGHPLINLFDHDRQY